MGHTSSCTRFRPTPPSSAIRRRDSGSPKTTTRNGWPRGKPMRTRRRASTFGANANTTIVRTQTISVTTMPTMSRVPVNRYRILDGACASGYRCLACDHNYETTADSLELCHLLTLEEVNDVDVDEQTALYDTCGLLQVHDVYNTILLCSTCREHFDQHWLGIQEVGNTYSFRWVVQTALRSIRLPHSRDKTYGTLQDTQIVFPFVVPVRMAIAHRYQRFVSRANDRKRKVNSDCTKCAWAVSR